MMLIVLRPTNLIAPQMNIARMQLFAIYALSALFSGGRLFVGAISVLYVLSHGISIGQFAIIKSIQVATFLLLDIPSGLLVKKIGYQKSLLLTFIFSMTGLFLYIIGNGFLSFLLAEFIIAISLCLIPAAFIDYMMDFLDRHPEYIVEKVFHRNDMYTSIANVVCGAFGGYLYTQGKIIPYVAGILLQSFGLYIIFKMKPLKGKHQEHPITMANFIKKSLSNLRITDSYLLIPIILLFIIQLTIQPLYHYWQPLFFEINPYISGTMLGFLFMSYSFCGIILNYIFSKLVHIDFFKSLNCVFTLLIGSTIFYYITAITQNEVIAFSSFTILQGLLFTSLTCLSAFMSKLIDKENRPVVLKIISFLSRIGMLISFGYIQIFAFIEEKSVINRMEVHHLYFQAATVLSIAVLLILIIRYCFSYLKYGSEIGLENR
jgi:hypothetical protein